MNIQAKRKLAREWIHALGDDDPGEWQMEQDDMDLIKEALVSWIQHQDSHELEIVIIVDGIPYEAKKR